MNVAYIVKRRYWMISSTIDTVEYVRLIDYTVLTHALISNTAPITLL